MRSHYLPRLNPRGFTIVELLITVAVLLILLSISFKPFGRFIVDQRLRQAGYESAGYLRTSRALAMQTNTSCVIGTLNQKTTIGPQISTLENACNNSLIYDPSTTGLSNAFYSEFSVVYTKQGFAAGIVSIIETRLSADGSDSVVCIAISVPSAITRIGWSDKKSTDCDYTQG